MKIKSRLYAQALVELSAEVDKKKVAKVFWEKLQKNHQYKDMGRILDLMDEESAKKDNKILAKIYSQNELSTQEETTLKKNLEKLTKKEIILKKYLKTDATGIIAKLDDFIIDYSLEGKIQKLKSKLGRF